MGGGNRRNKSSTSFFSIFNCFTSKNKYRSGYYDDCGRKTWPSDEDKGNWGVAEPNINRRAEDFIRKCKNRISESDSYQVDPAL
ncbi:DUF761 domain protein [Medicago truncatula]|uniref:DUF761 domain protein n=1 Tax=Medicago truncatula TaxID=3880 RepID=A0A072TSB6_MEDTR|nr:DUF761 domain protein [Medicago truncatula]KEH16430.1 DUF761 domain protein [Medicago truncatula]